MQNTFPYSPVFELTRGVTTESIHLGSIAVVDVHGRLLAWYGDPQAVTYLRSTAKPFQVLPFLQHGGQDVYNLSLKEIAIACASHSGTDEHVATVQSMQAKTGVSEVDLLCGTHYPIHSPTADVLREHKELPTSNRHNCSGKHTGMLAYANLKKQQAMPYTADLQYIDPANSIQQEILQTFAEMCSLPIEQVSVGIDGCSAPNFAVPLRSAALAYARLCDPEAGAVAPPERASACRIIVKAMTSNPEMVGGPERFDTRLMQVTHGRIVSKGGAEGYQGLGLMPGVLGVGSPAVGIVMKVSDGDARGKVHQAIALETLRQLGALSQDELEALAEFGPTFPVYNWRKLLAGEAYPIFTLERAA